MQKKCVDYLIVGAGIAGLSFVELALQNQKSIVVFDNNSQSSSKIAGGLYNPVILKRFTSIENAQLQINCMIAFYANVEKRLATKIDHKMSVLRKFFSVEEQNNWFAAADKVNLAPFLSLDLVKTKINAIDSPFDFGKVLQTGYVDTKKYLSEYHLYLQNIGILNFENFEYSKLKFENDFIFYKNIIAKNIIFAEGFGLHHNPFFNFLPLDGTKGELFIIYAPKLDLNVIINTSVFIIPIGENLFKVGATYNWQDKTDTVTEEGKFELITKIKEILNCDFEIISHLAGIRPTVRDRKPLLGAHFLHKNMYVLNGLGTRGVMLGPNLAHNLLQHIEYGLPIDSEFDVSRIYKKIAI